MKIAAPEIPFSVLAVAVVAAGVGLYVWKSGGIAKAAKGAGAAVVNAAVEAAKGAAEAAGSVVKDGVSVISEEVGLPTPYDTTTDPRIARWLLDNVGAWEASKWAGVPALVSASRMAPGTGTAPAPGSRIARAFPNAATYDEIGRLERRYPAPASFPDNYSDPTQYGLGA